MSTIQDLRPGDMFTWNNTTWLCREANRPGQPISRQAGFWDVYMYRLSAGRKVDGIYDFGMKLDACEAILRDHSIVIHERGVPFHHWTQHGDDDEDYAHCRFCPNSPASRRQR